MTPSTATSLALLPGWLDPAQLLHDLGPYLLAGLCLIVFAECGLLVGFFLPGDSLLFTAGLFVATDRLAAPLWLVCLLLVLSAVAGNVVGYGIGRKLGPAVFARPDSRLFKREYVERTRVFFERYGNRAIVLGRFVPVVRTFITVLAGVGRMEPRRYLTYTVLGGALWAVGVTLLGFWLGRFTVVKDHIELILIGIVLVSLVPVAIEALRGRRAERAGERA